MNRIENFIKEYNYDSLTALKSDASSRRYVRVNSPDGLIIMDSEKEDIKPFLKIAQFLDENGLRAPKVKKYDIDKGLIILEDFGDNLLSKKVTPENEFELYKASIDQLIELYKCKNPNIKEYTKEEFLREISLFYDWYVKFILAKSDAGRNEFLQIWSNIFDNLKIKKKMVVLRDYHADNLMVLDKSIGLLDFQDALIGSPTYDIASLLEDVRRDVSPEIKDKLIRYYVDTIGENYDDFIHDYNIWSAARLLKILGIFTRLKYRDHKDHYMEYIPRTVSLLNKHTHPVLKEADKMIKLLLEDVSIIIFAAGFGTRLRPITNKVPKSLVEVNKSPIIKYSIENIKKAYANNIIVNTHYLSEEIEKYIASLNDVNIKISKENEILETGGGIVNMLPLINSSKILTINSDVIHGGNPITHLINEWDDKMDGLLLLIPVEKAIGYRGNGDFGISEDGRLNTINKNYVFTGMQILKKDLFKSYELKKFSLSDVYKEKNLNGNLDGFFGIVHEDFWLHIGDPESLNEANKFLSNRN